ncbi:unnamed protein product, partial [Didymodactylos carnosus]
MSKTSRDYYASSNNLTDQSCAICSRSLYSFEQVRVCNLCHSSYHWRCVKPDLTLYDDNDNFICKNCETRRNKRDLIPVNNQSSHNTTTITPTKQQHNYQRHSSQRPSLGTGIKIKSPESNTDYKEFVDAPNNKISSTENVVTNAVKYFEEKQLNSAEQYSSRKQRNRNTKYNPYPQQQEYSNKDSSSRINKNSSVDDLTKKGAQSSIFENFLQLRDYPINYNKPEQYQTTPNQSEIYNGSGYNNGVNVGGSIVLHHKPWYDQEKESDEIDDENYLRRGVYNSKKENGENAMFRTQYQYTQGYAGNIDEDKNIESSSLSAITAASHSASSSINDTSHRYSTYGYDPSTIRLVGLPELPYPSNINQMSKYNQQIEINGHFPNRSTVELMPNSKQDSFNSHFRQQNIIGSESFLNTVMSLNGNRNYGSVEKNLADLVSMLGRQLEIESQRLNAKVEEKLQNLEGMMNQQTHIVRKHDEIIEHLKTKISTISNQRNGFQNELNKRVQERAGNREQEEYNKSSNNSDSTTPVESQKNSPRETTDSNKNLKNQQQDVIPVDNDYETINRRVGIQPIETYKSSVYDQKPAGNNTKKLVATHSERDLAAKNRPSEILSNDGDDQSKTVKALISEIQQRNNDKSSRQNPERRLTDLIRHDNDPTNRAQDREQKPDKTGYNKAVIRQKSDNKFPTQSAHKIQTTVHNTNSTRRQKEELHQDTDSGSTASEFVHITQKNNGLGVRTSSFDNIPRPQKQKYLEKTRSLEHLPASRHPNALKAYLQRKNLSKYDEQRHN